MLNSLYVDLVSEILRGPYVKVTYWNAKEQTLKLTKVDIKKLFKNFQDDFEMLFNSIEAKSLDESLILRYNSIEALRYLEVIFNEIGFYWKRDEYGVLEKTLDWEKYVKYDFEFLLLDNSWGSLYRSSKPCDTEDGEIDTGHEFGKEYDIEAERMVKNQIIELQEMFRVFKKEKYEYLSRNSIPTNFNEERPLIICNDKNQPSTLIDPKIKKRQEELRKSIKAEINTLDNQWEYAFFEEKDCDDFIEILVSFFTNQEYLLPDDPIPIKKGCKTKLSIVLNAIYKLGRTSKMLTKDEGFLEICKKLSEFKDLNLNRIACDINRNNKI